MRLSPVLALTFFSTALLAADVRPRVDRMAGEDPPAARHFILEPQHVLSESERADLAAKGCEIQKPLSDGRYLIRLSPGTQIDESDPRIRSLVPLSPSKKLQPSAYREAARGKAFGRFHVIFHDDTSFDDARKAIVQAGGAIADPLAFDFQIPRRLIARIPSTALLKLAEDERVLTIYGAAPLRAKLDNAISAQVSNVNIVQAAPYGLSGSGVVLSYFELGQADATHREFGGRLTVHGTLSSNDDYVKHATHVAGTMIAAGIDSLAKGMAPNATLHEFEANRFDENDEPVFLTDKQKELAAIGSVADNNSWGYVLGWRPSTSGSVAWTWTGFDEYIGGYDFFASSIDGITRSNGVLMVHSSGNEADNTGPILPPQEHYHVDDNGDAITSEVYCYSQDGSGNDCPSQCTSGAKHCETVRHPAHNPFGSVGNMASAKNAIAVGAVTSTPAILAFSSRGPTRDGRVKPDVVARGSLTYSTFPNNSYGRLQGTSMAAPVVTGIAALLTEQWRKTFNGTNPGAQILKTLIIAGAYDAGNAGPDYSYGFGVADAKASTDLILADGGSGKRIRVASVGQGEQYQVPLTVSTQQNLRVVLGWADPEVTILGDELANKALVNDLDLKVIDATCNVVLPYVLDKFNPSQFATRGVNSVDNVEEIEIKNASAGTYQVIINGARVGTAPPQRFVLVANADLGAPLPACIDVNEPNDTQAAAYGYLTNGQTVTGNICSSCGAADIDYFKVRVNTAGTIRAVVTAGDTSLRVTLSTSATQLATAIVPAGTSASVDGSLSAPSAALDAFVRIEADESAGSHAIYTLTVTYPYTTPARRHSARR